MGNIMILETVIPNQNVHIVTENIASIFVTKLKYAICIIAKFVIHIDHHITTTWWKHMVGGLHLCQR